MVTTVWRENVDDRMRTLYEEVRRRIADIHREKPLTPRRTVSRAHRTIAEALDLCLAWARYRASWIYGETPTSDMIMTTNRPLQEVMHLGTHRSGVEKKARRGICADRRNI